MMKDTATGDQKTSRLLLTRLLDAPRELVWKAWTDPAHFRRWWGPRDYTCPFCEMDLRVGGRYLNCMRSPEGRDYWSTGVFQEIVPVERLVFTDAFADQNGNIVSAAHYGMSADFPLEMLVSVTFEDAGEKTRITLEHLGLVRGPESEGTRQGWSESLDKLAGSLEA